MRGAVSYISFRYSKANNKYLKSYDPKQEPKHIHLDTNNLSGYAMSKFLSTCEFKRINNNNNNSNNNNSIWFKFQQKITG